MMTTRNVHYVLSSHWDREWYQSFQDFRSRLVHMLDEVLLGIEQGELIGPFTLDGQAIPIEDYLEVRPERTELVMRLIREGKIIIGPWYVLPDEWLVSGESLIRNLELGRSLARRWGAEPSNAGFVCDLFGHIGQLPQLLAGFNVRGALLWRGVNCPGTRHLNWIGADGTRLPSYRFGRGGYCDYAFKVRQTASPDKPRDAEILRNNLRGYLKEEAAHTQMDPILIFDGADHQVWDREAYAVCLHDVEQADSTLAIQHSTLDRYLEEMLKHQNQITQTRVGELRETGRLDGSQDWQYLISAVLSSRPWIKQQNAHCQTQLCHWAEPLGVMAEAFAGKQYPGGFLDVAWKWLLKNHPHDSICGCSIDEVHDAMRFRFQQSRQIAERQASDAMHTIAANIGGEIGEHELRVTVFNPLPRTLKQVVRLQVDIPEQWPKYSEFFGYESKPAFHIHDEQGRVLEYQHLAQSTEHTRMRIVPNYLPRGDKVTQTELATQLTLPAMGYITLTVKAEQRGIDPAFAEAGIESTLPTRQRTTPSLVTAEDTLENNRLRVKVAADGTLTMTDKLSGHTYRRLLTLEDVADIGDGWNHCPPVNNTTHVSTAATASVAITHQGPMLGALRIFTEMKVPAAMDWRHMRRSDEMVTMALIHTVSLARDADRIEVQTTLNNSANDHRLRVLFPTGASDASKYWADSAFDVLERDISLHPDNHTFREVESETRPQQSFTAVTSGGRGLAVVSEGIMESAVLDRPDRAIALTLFRATDKTILTDGEPGGQVRGPMIFRYWILPIDNDLDPATLLDTGQQLAAGTKAVQLSSQEIRTLRTVGTALLPSESMCQIERPLVLTSLRKSARGYEARVFNPRSETVTANFTFNLPITRIDLAGFEGEENWQSIAIRDGQASLTVKKKRIVTLVLRP